MLNIILWVCKSFLSMIGSIMFGIILIVLLAPIWPDLLAAFIAIPLGLLIAGLLFAGMFLDYKLRKKFNLLHTKTFSLLWTIVSSFELGFFAVFVIITLLGLIPISVLICDVVIYIILSILILSSKIKKITSRFD